ncbi:Aerotolerance protein BatE [hydrothermal vent metagenome]|uniref:Aerotolerance protein BatE n=1 Tax=hydrothermal vent metagenome TaxID=652676 RepID=A0A3B0UJX0_9ZZZZ
MKIKSTILFLLMLLAFFCQGQEQPLFEKANQLYVNEEYAKAINIYEQIIHSGKESAELYFNLGNAYYKTGNANMAILNYERALLLSPNDEDIIFNLRIANQFVVDNIEALPKPFFVRWYESVINLYPSDTWAIISTSSFVVFLFLLGFFIFSRSVAVKRFSFLLGILLFVVTLFTFSFSSKQSKKIKGHKYAIVFCPRVTVKSSPSSTGTDLFLIHEGLKVEISDSLDTWREIRLADGNQGWLPDSCIVKI